MIMSYVITYFTRNIGIVIINNSLLAVFPYLANRNYWTVSLFLLIATYTVEIIRNKKKQANN